MCRFERCLSFVSPWHIDHLTKLGEIGPNLGYQANATKSWLIVKEEHYEHAVTFFNNSGVRIMIDSQMHLGTALETKSFVEAYVTEKVNEWTNEVDTWPHWKVVIHLKDCARSISATRECYTMPIPDCSHRQNWLH